MEKQLFRDRQAGRVFRVDREIEGEGGGRERESGQIVERERVKKGGESRESDWVMGGGGKREGEWGGGEGERRKGQR